MKLPIDISGFIFITISLVVLPGNITQKALAVGCETYYRVTGEIAGCSDISTERPRQQWLERYSICLEIQLAQEISEHKDKMTAYYARQNRNSQQDTDVDSWLSVDDRNPWSLSTSVEKSARDGGDTDFCNATRK